MQAIRLENVTKRYTLEHQRHSFLNNLIPNFPGHKITEEFFALKDVTLDIPSGSVVGLIGRNGAGKTTLLSILAGTCTPTEGKVQVGGRVASLLTIGAGFDENFSGEENIFLNASILGMSKEEVRGRFADIVEFSELDGFLDVAVKSYSAGMQLRLGFSIAVCVGFDILIIDEVLAVGDLAFQRKCYEKMIEFKRRGKTIIFTTQDMGITERLSDIVYLLEDGQVASAGDPELVVAEYLKLLDTKGFSKHQ